VHEKPSILTEFIIRQRPDCRRRVKECEFDYKPQGGFGIGISMKVTSQPQSYHHWYREKELETDVVCDQCTLIYAIYGAFAFCLDCGSHNSLTILRKNLELAEKVVALAGAQDREVAEYLVGDALENIVSAFDGFGREICRVAGPKATNPSDAEDVRFQNLIGARGRVQKHFGFDLMTSISTQDWEFACRCFQKRHLLAHKMGLIDDDYVRASRCLRPRSVSRAAAYAEPILAAVLLRRGPSSRPRPCLARYPKTRGIPPGVCPQARCHRSLRRR